MNWFLLFLLIPLVVVPVVLLFGFAGCADIAELGDGPGSSPAAPSNLVAKTCGTSVVRLRWKDNSGDIVTFVITRTTFGPDGTPTTLPGIKVPFFRDHDLPEGTHFLYRVQAKADGVELSALSNPADATTFTQPPTWHAAFEVQLTTNEVGPGVGVTPASWANTCMVQRIATGRLKFGGTKVRITLRGSTQSNFVIDKVSISQAATKGDLWQSNEDLPEVTVTGASGVTLPAGEPITLDPVDYDLDPTTDLIIAFDINKAGGGARRAHVPGSSLSFRNDTDQAANKTRFSDYLTLDGEFYLIEKIEVL